jgi:flagellar protein FliS
MLYDGIRKNIILAQRAIKNADTVTAHTKLIRAQDIVTELINCLDLSIPMSTDLLNLYEFILRSLQDANMRKDAAILVPVLEMVDSLREAWQEISQNTKGSVSALAEDETE